MLNVSEKPWKNITYEFEIMLASSGTTNGAAELPPQKTKTFWSILIR